MNFCLRYKSKIILYMHFPVNENEIILRFQLSFLFILIITLNFFIELYWRVSSSRLPTMTIACLLLTFLCIIFGESRIYKKKDLKMYHLKLYINSCVKNVKYWNRYSLIYRRNFNTWCFIPMHSISIGIFHFLDCGWVCSTIE